MSFFRQVLLAVCFAAAMFGQGFSQLTGVVTDGSGSVMASVSLELTNTDTDTKRTVLSSSTGVYNFEQVTPGKYSLRATAAGFSVQNISGIQLLVNTPSTVNVTLQVGAVSETVAVTSEAAQVNTTDASLGNAINTNAIVELPSNARNPAGLLALQAGVTYVGQGSTYGVSDSPGTADRINGSVNGSKPDQNNITLDGVDVNDQNTRNPFQSVLRVTLDSTQEFRTTTMNPTAEEGRGSGAQIALVTKSGTNSVHGSLYEYHRNTLTAANSFFNNLDGLPRDKLIRNVFGASVGGPIRKNRLFYFLNYEGRRDASETSVSEIVPTASLRQGVITYINQAGGVSTSSPAQIKAADPAGIGVNPAVLNVLNAYPLPNDSGSGDGYNTQGYRFNASTPLRWNTYIAKLDYNLDSAGKNTVFWRGNLQNDNIGGTPQFPGQAPASVDLDNSKGYAAGWTSIVKPNLVSTFRYGYTRSGHESTGVVNAPYVDFRGISSLNATTTGLARIIPVHQFTEDMAWTKGSHDIRFGGVARVIRNNSTNYGSSYPSGEVTYSYLAGTGQALKPSDLNANFSTSYRASVVDLLGPISFASVTYNYLLNGDTVPFGQPVKRQYGSEEYEFYVNDSWRVRKDLTVNVGLRYSFAPAIRETRGYQVSPNIDLAGWFTERGNLANAGESQALAGDISYVLANGPGGHALYNAPKLNFSPRLAIAYSPESDHGLGKFFFGGAGKSSIRAGFGIYYDLFGQSLIRNFDANAPGLSTQFQTPASADLSTQPRFSGYNSLPLNILPSAPAFGFPFTPPSDTDHGFAISNAIDQNIKQPYTINFNLTYGRELGKGFYLQGSYVGRLSRRSLVVTDLAQPTNLKDPVSGQTWNQAASELAADARAGLATSQVKTNAFWENMFPSFAGDGQTATQGVYDAEMQYYPTDITSGLLDLDELCSCSRLGANSMFNAQYASLFAYRSLGKANYHSMQWLLRKRFSGGLQFDFNFTWAHSIDLTSAAESNFGASSYAVLLYPYNAALNRADSDFDIRRAWTGYAVYELPVGKSKPFLNTNSKLLNVFVGGWQVSGSWNITSGLPRSVLNSGSWPTNWNYSGFATQVGVVPASGSSKNVVGINGTSGPNIFADPSGARDAYDYSYAGQIGQRNGIRGDGFMTIDASLAKRFYMPWSEKQSMQFRWEVFNVPNTVRFDVNTASLDVGNTGTFGKYTGALTDARVMQFGLRYEF